MEVHEAHYPPCEIRYKDPFGSLKAFRGLSDIDAFFPQEARLIRALFLSNFIASLVEMAEYARKPEHLEHQFGGGTIPLRIPPVWVLMDGAEFQRMFCDAFGTSAKIIELLFPEKFLAGVDFWTLWKKWNEVCCGFWSHRISETFFFPAEKPLPDEPFERTG